MLCENFNNTKEPSLCAGRISNFLKAVTNSLNVGFGFGGSLVYHLKNYPYSKRRLIGLQILYNASGVYWETAAFDGGFYIPLKQYFSTIFKKAGTNLSTIKSIMKKLRFRLYYR